MEKNSLLKNNKFKRLFMIVFLLLAGLLATFLLLGKANIFNSSSILGRTFNAQANATKFVVVSESSNKIHTIYSPTNAKSKKVHIYYKKAGASSWESDVTRLADNGEVYTINLNNINGVNQHKYEHEVFRILVKCDLSGSAWKPSGWSYNSDIGWAYKDFTITWPTNNSNNTSTSKNTTTKTQTSSENICSITPGAYTVTSGNAGTAKITCKSTNGWPDASISSNDIKGQLVTNLLVNKINQSLSSLEYQVKYYASSTAGTASISLKAGAVKNSSSKTNTAVSTSFSVTSDRRSSTPPVSKDVDNVKPSCSIAFASSSITSGGTGTATITCNDAGFADTNIYISDFTNSSLTNFKITGGSVAMGTVTKNVSFTASNTTGTGKMTLTAGAVRDNAGNKNEAVSKTISIKAASVASKPTTKPGNIITSTTMTLKYSQNNSITRTTVGNSVTVNAGEKLYFWPSLSNKTFASASYQMNLNGYGTINGNEFLAGNTQKTITVTATIKDTTGKSYNKTFKVIIQNTTKTTTTTTETPPISTLTIKTAQVSTSLTRATINRTVTIEVGDKLYFWPTLSNTGLLNCSYSMDPANLGTITGNQFTSNGTAGTIKVTTTVMGKDKRQYNKFFNIEVKEKEPSVAKSNTEVKSTELTVKVTKYKASPTRATIINSVSMNAGERLYFWPSLNKTKIVSVTYTLKEGDKDYGAMQDNSFVSNGTSGKFSIVVAATDANNKPLTKSFYVNVNRVSSAATFTDVPTTPTDVKQEKSGPKCTVLINKTSIAIKEAVDGTMGCTDVSGFNNPSLNNYSFGFDSNVVDLKLGTITITNKNNLSVNFTITGKKAGATSFGLKSNKLSDKLGNKNIATSLVKSITVQKTEQVVEKTFNDLLVHIDNVKVSGNTIIITAYGATHYCVTTTNDISSCNWTTNNRINTQKYKRDQDYYVFVKDNNYESNQSSKITVPGTKTRINNDNVGPKCSWQNGIKDSVTIRANESKNISFKCVDEDIITTEFNNSTIKTNDGNFIALKSFNTNNKNITTISVNAKKEGTAYITVTGIKDEFEVAGKDLTLKVVVDEPKQIVVDKSNKDIYFDINDYTRVHELYDNELDCIGENFSTKKDTVATAIKPAYNAARKYGINVFMFLGQTTLESKYYTSSAYKNCNNPGGYKSNDQCATKYKKFSSREAGFTYISQKLKNNYLTPGAVYWGGSKSLAAVKINYCPDSDGCNPEYVSIIKGIANDYVNVYKKYCLNLGK